MNEIISTGDVAESEWDGSSEPEDVRTDMVATKAAEHRGIEFHVSMRDYTMEDMEKLIVEAAARMIVGRHSDSQMAKSIEAKCIELVNAKATAKLETVTAEIIDLPVTPNFGDKKPVTMREMIGLFGREFLTEKVDSNGKPPTDSWGRRSETTRMEYLVGRAMDTKFKAEIERSTNAVVAEVRAAILERHQSLLVAEKARFLEALAKVSA